MMNENVLHSVSAGITRRYGLVLIAGLGMIAAGWRVALPALLGLRGGVDGLIYAALYNRTVISTSYFSDGFVRRGLAGTIVNLWPTGWIVGAVLFTLLSVVWLAVPLMILIRRVDQHSPRGRSILYAVVITASPQLFAGWAADIARTDLFAMGFIAWAAVAMENLRPRRAIVAILVGTLVHEIALVFGGALLTALLGSLVGSGRMSRKSAIGYLVVLVMGQAVIMLLQSWLTAAPAVIARHMMTSGPIIKDAGLIEMKMVATYMQVAGSRGLRTAMCFNAQGGILYLVWSLVNLSIITIYIAILALGRNLISFCVAAVVPAVFLLIVANDAGRWMQAAILNAWLLAVLLNRWGLVQPLSGKRVVASIVLLLALIPFGVARYDRANRMPSYVVQALFSDQSQSLEKLFAKCDYYWTNLLPKVSADMAGDLD